MTNREFFTTILSYDEDIPQALIEFARSELAKMDARNEKRKNTMTEEQLKNQKTKEKIVQLLSNTPTPAAEIGLELGLSTQKVSALCRQLVTEGAAIVTELKIPKKGKVNGYSIAPEVVSAEGGAEGGDGADE